MLIRFRERGVRESQTIISAAVVHKAPLHKFHDIGARRSSNL